MRAHALKILRGLFEVEDMLIAKKSNEYKETNNRKEVA